MVEDGTWLDRLQGELRGLLAPVFAQARSRLAAFAYIGALLAEPGDRRSCWQLAERAGHATPRRMQALLAEHAWDWTAALAALQRFILACLGDPAAIVVLDETAELKKGDRTVGVARQHAGITGQVENCQTVVFAAYVTARTHTLFDFRLYLPKQWCEDEQRRQRGHVPDDVEFATKPALGTAMITAAADAGVPFAWVAADEVYGRSRKLREACETAGKGYVVAVPVNFTVCAPSGRKTAVAAVARLIPKAAWETRSCGRGCKGHCDYAWAWAATASPRHWVLIRRSLTDPSDLAFFYCHSPAGPGSGGPSKNATSKARGKQAWTSTRSGPGPPSTATPSCRCAPRRCWPSPPPARPRPPRSLQPPAAPGSPRPGATPASCPPPPAAGHRATTPAWSRSASPRPAASSAWPPRR
jgi:DDE superfamily endonuclease